MRDQQIRVTFQPLGRSVYVLSGSKVLEAAARVGLAVETPCGGQGTCGKCRVRFTAGACPPGEAEKALLSTAELSAGWRLACQQAICSESVIEIPSASLFGNQHRILTATQAGADEEISPAVRKVYVQAARPMLSDSAPDLCRLERSIGQFKTDLSLLRELPGLLRENDFTGTAVLADHHLIDFEPGCTTDQCYGVAFDLGTTTIVASLLDLTNGQELALASAMNPQVALGDDVLSRIKHASQGPQQLQELRAATVSAVSEMLQQLCQEAGVSLRNIYELTFAGNTTMEHLLCGLDPTQLGGVPFVPVHRRGLLLPAAQLDLPIHPRGNAYIFPIIGGFVGGDTVAGMLATRLGEADGPTLLVDIGTNGEIVLAHDGKLWAASTAAGPAFEGARISCGMRAASGAIEKVVLDDDLRLNVIGGGQPVGICGSGLIDLAAELLEHGIVLPEGRLLGPQELPAGLGKNLRRRVRKDDDGRTSFVLTERGDHGAPLALTQKDIRELQLAGGAIRAGIAILLRQAGLEAGQLRRVLIAGGFGSFIRRSNAQRIGLLPTSLPHDKIHFAGNTSLAGAKWALLSTRARRQAERLASRAEHIQLSQDADFQEEFAESMIFPSA